MYLDWLPASSLLLVNRWMLIISTCAPIMDLLFYGYIGFEVASIAVKFCSNIITTRATTRSIPLKYLCYSRMNLRINCLSRLLLLLLPSFIFILFYGALLWRIGSILFWQAALIRHAAAYLLHSIPWGYLGFIHLTPPSFVYAIVFGLFAVSTFCTAEKIADTHQKRRDNR